MVIKSLYIFISCMLHIFLAVSKSQCLLKHLKPIDGVVDVEIFQFYLSISNLCHT